MIRVLTIFLLAAVIAMAQPIISVGTGMLNGELVRQVNYSEKVAGHSIKVFLEQGDYDFSGCKISGGKDYPEGRCPADYQPATIDGVVIFGTEGKNPFGGAKGGKKVHDTLRRIDLKWDDEKVDVPKALHVNLMGLELSPEWGAQMLFSPNPTGTSLLIQLIGSNAKKPYLVSLILQKNGKHQQIYHGFWKGGLLSKEKAWELVKVEQAGANKPAATSESKSEGKEKPKKESGICPQ